MISKQPKKIFQAETYLGTCQAPIYFFENSYRLLPANYFCKKTRMYISGGLKYASQRLD